MVVVAPKKAMPAAKTNKAAPKKVTDEVEETTMSEEEDAMDQKAAKAKH